MKTIQVKNGVAIDYNESLIEVIKKALNKSEITEQDIIDFFYLSFKTAIDKEIAIEE